MNSDLIKRIVESALMAAGKSLDINHLERLFEDEMNVRLETKLKRRLKK